MQKRTEIASLKEYAQEQFLHEKLAYNYRMTNIQAAIGIPQVKKLDGFVKQRRAIAKAYQEGLGDNASITIPQTTQGAEHVYWMYPLLLPDDKTQLSIVKTLLQQGIDIRPFFYPLHLQPFYGSQAKLPISEGLFRKGILLPTNTDLTQEDITKICEVIQKAL